MIYQQRYYRAALLIMLLAAACRDKPVETKEATFFPVKQFIQGQLRTIDSMHMPLIMITVSGNRMDTVAITTASLHQLAADFLSPDINDSALHRYYTENSFADQTIASATLTYSTRNRDLPVQRVDVIIRPDPVLSDQVNSIYMEKSYREKDTGVVKKLYWKADRNFQIITIKQAGSHTENRVVKVVWNDQE